MAKLIPILLAVMATFGQHDPPGKPKMEPDRPQSDRPEQSEPKVDPSTPETSTPDSPPSDPAATPALPATPDRFVFDRRYVDLNYGGNGRPGWVRGGDLDLDGDIDLVAGGGNALLIYLNGGDSKSWRRTENVDGTQLIGANAGALLDIDRDGDLDVVSALYYRELGWWENPGASRIALPWIYHRVAKERWFLHDLILVDFDADGERREILCNLMDKGMRAKSRIVSFAIPEDPTQPWNSMIVQPGRDHGNDNHAGLDVGDIDGDGQLDIAFANGWYKAPETDGDTWKWHTIHGRGGVSNVALRDLDDDGRLDVITTLGHRSKGVFWYQCPPKMTSKWREHVVHAQINLPESLAVVDLDRDGDLDLVTADLDDKAWNQTIHNVYVFENRDGVNEWRQHNVGPNGHASHLLQVLDVNGDGWLDLISEACGHSVVSYYENRSAAGQ